MTDPLISVVTPCLNAAATIDQTLASVRDQGLGERVEHVVVDGGSTDGTVDILREAPDVRYISEPDRGLSDAMNKGVRMARGQAIGWLNADDFYLPGALAKVAAAWQAATDPVWVTGPCIIVGEDGREIRKLVTRYKRALLRRHSLSSYLVQNYIASPATFASRQALLDVGGFQERFRYSMDYDVWLQLARRADPIVIDEPLAAFRMAGESLSMTGFERQFVEHAQNAREHGDGHPVAVAANQVLSRGIVYVYRALAWNRRRRATA